MVVFGVGMSVMHCYLRRQVFYPGNIIEGFVELVVNTPMEVVALRVVATGKEKVVVRWTTHNGKHATHHVLTETTCVYKEMITLAGQMKSTGSRQSTVVSPGRYTYPFTFQLPMNIPPSFSQGGRSQAGTVYYIKAYVDIPVGGVRQCVVDRQRFTVVKPMPLAQWIDRSAVSVDRNWQVTFCCCVDKGTVTGRLTMDRTIIAIDRDNLVIVADIDNRRGREPVTSLTMELIHSMTYRAQWKTVSSRCSVGATKSTNNPILPGTGGRLEATIPLPRLLVPTLVSRGITSEYFVNVELNIPWATNPQESFGVFIAQAVDETDLSPAAVRNANPFPAVLKGQYTEYYYQSPPKPCHPLNPIPIGPPPGAMLWNVQLVPQLPLPAAGWMAPAAQRPPVNDHNDPGYDPTRVQWQEGVQQQETVVVRALPPPLDFGTAVVTSEVLFA